MFGNVRSAVSPPTTTEPHSSMANSLRNTIFSHLLHSLLLLIDEIRNNGRIGGYVAIVDSEFGYRSCVVATAFVVVVRVSLHQLRSHFCCYCLLACSIHQVLHHLTFRYREKRWDLRQLIGSGGMPSSHSATVTALAIGVGFVDGFGGSQFATAMILACIVMYDATGVRLQAGRQAEVLNQIVCELPAEHPLAESRPLRELLGHTPPQVVVGGLLGIVTAAVVHIITGSGSGSGSRS